MLLFNFLLTVFPIWLMVDCALNNELTLLLLLLFGSTAQASCSYQFSSADVIEDISSPPLK